MDADAAACIRIHLMQCTHDRAARESRQVACMQVNFNCHSESQLTLLLIAQAHTNNQPRLAAGVVVSDSATRYRFKNGIAWRVTAQKLNLEKHCRIAIHRHFPDLGTDSEVHYM